MGFLPRGGRSATGALLGVVVVAALMVFVVPTGLASASAVLPLGSSTSEWAYGAVKTVSFSGISHVGDVPYVGNATYGFTVVVHQINSTTDPDEFELTAQRTMGATLNVKYCSPSCRSVTYYGELSARAWETVNSTAYVTRGGTVYEDGAPVPAFALLNATSVQAGNITESTSSLLPSGTQLAPVSRAGYLGAEVRSTGIVAFSAPLGLFPTNLSTSQTWNSSAPFQASLDATYAYLAAHSGPAVTGSLRGNGTLPVAGSGTVAVSGSYTAGDTIDLGGVDFGEIALSVAGPFTLRDGFILVPAASDMFQGSSEPWSSNESGAATASLAFVDVRGEIAAGHFGLGASSWVYDSSTLEPASLAAPTPSGVTDLAGSGSPDTAPSTVVQGQPQSETQSGATQSCLITGSGCPSSSTPSPFRALAGLFAVGVVATAVLVVAVLVIERRRIPPPTYPNAALYPPGTAGTPRLTPAGPSPPPPTTPEDDPLGNLW